MPPLVKLVPELGLREADLCFAVEGPLTYRTLLTNNGILIRFGEFAKSSLVIFGVILAVSVGSIPVLAHAGMPLIVALFPLAGVLFGYGLFFLRQRRLKGIQLEVHTNRCVFRQAESSQSIGGVKAVILMNSYRFRNGTPATEGVSEVFLEVEGPCFAPLASEGSYGGLDDLAQAVANSLQVEVKSLTR
ncbi:MAG TPA: hypothetical protein VN673_04735 [Clostridia bacterium]|nr:hypothetical protein [Clostridia bacterium]